NQVTYNNEAGGYADTGLQRNRYLQCGYCCDQFKSSTYGPLSVVLMGFGIAEIYEDAVAHVVRDEPPEGTHSLCNAFLVGRSDLAEVFRVHARRQCRRADQVGKLTVTWRRSARSSDCALGVLDAVAAPKDGVLPLASLRRAAIASRSFR